MRLLEPDAKAVLENQLDISHPEDEVQVKISYDRKVLWVNIGPVLALRVCQCKGIEVEDDSITERNIQLRTSEIILLRRALRMYSQTYDDLRSKSLQKDKDELKAMSKAADNLSNRLMSETTRTRKLPKKVKPTKESL